MAFARIVLHHRGLRLRNPEVRTNVVHHLPDVDGTHTAQRVRHQVGANWRVAILDKADGPIPVVRSEKPGEYKDVYGKKKILATRPVSVFCSYSSWAVLYAWTNDRVAKICLRD